jgi:hypothetical protein
VKTTATREATERDRFIPVRVQDPNGHRAVVLEGLRASATVTEIRARAIAALKLPEDGLDWSVRQDRTGRLLREEQRLGEFAGEQTQVDLTMQPDASLG